MHMNKKLALQYEYVGELFEYIGLLTFMLCWNWTIDITIAGTDVTLEQKRIRICEKKNDGSGSYKSGRNRIRTKC